MNSELPTTEYQHPRYVDAAEIAKMIRKTLKGAFPGVTFSVRTDKYAGGSSVDIGWTDGPTTSQVDARVSAYAGARFDGMTDLAYCAGQWYCPEHGPRTAEIFGNSYDSETAGVGTGNGPVQSRCCAKAELINSLASYVHTRRYLSPEFEAELGAIVAKERGIETYDKNHHDGWEFASTDLWRLSEETARPPEGKRTT